MIPTRQGKLPLSTGQAATLAIGVLAFLAADDDVLGQFLATTGIGPSDLRSRAEDPTLLAAVLDYLLRDEKLLLRFCSETGTAPEMPARARAKLPGFMPFG